MDTNGKLNSRQIDFYREEGYLLLPDVLQEEDLLPVQQAMEEKVEEIAQQLNREGRIDSLYQQASFETRLALLFAGKTDQEFLRYGRSWRERRPGYFHLMTRPVILDMVESLIGAEIFANPVYNTRPKVPGVAAGAVPWHQDRSYWPDANANPVITVWVPLVNADEENGCLHIWPRTHRTRLLSWHSEQITGTGYTEVDEQHLQRIAKRREPVMLPLQRGGVIIFNDRCVHMSTPNRSQKVRWSVDLRYQPTDQDPMPGHGAGFLARSKKYPCKTASLQDWLQGKPEHTDS